MTTFLRLKSSMRFLILCLAFLGMSTEINAQTVLVDDFNRTDNTTVGNGWTEIETTGGAQIQTNRLRLGSATSGREFVHKDLSTLSNPIITDGITNNTSVITWAFNFRSSRSNPAGFDSGNYGMAYVLCKSATSTASGNGYAIVLGQSGTTDPIRLARFTGGGDLNNEYTDIISGGDYDAEYFSVRVTYNPVNDQWSLFAETNALAFPQADPRNTATQIGVATVSTTFTTTGNDLKYYGPYYNHSGSATENAIYDDIYSPNSPPLNAAPTATVNPISGTLTVGQVLTGSYTYNDANGDLEGTSTFQWYRADNGSGLNVAPIAGQTGTTYTLVSGDANKYIRFGVTPVAATGTSPGVEAFSAYAGPVSTGTNAASTITVDAGFTPATNVDYTAFTGTDVLTSSYEIARFSVNDIAGAPDDGLATTLTELSFSLSNAANIEKIAIYDDANAEIQELTAAATLNFTALNIVAASGASKSFSVRVTFKTAVMDNSQPQLIITNATADAAGSVFSSANAGGAASSVAGDDNKIEVTASVIGFIQQPSNTVVGVNMAPAVTVSAMDVNGNNDLDFTGNVTITSTGTLAAPQNTAAVAGVATFSTLNFTVIGSNLTLEASSAGFSNATSNTFNVSVQAAGQLIAEENFTFTGLLTANGYTTLSGAGQNDQSSGAAGLTYSGYGSTGVGNALLLATSGHDVSKTFTTTTAPNTIYAAFLVNITSAGTGDYFFALAPSSGGATFRGRLYVKAAAPGFVNFGITNTGTPGPVYGTTAFATGVTHLVVLKYQYTTGVSTVATVYVNPNLYAQPTTSEVSVTDVSNIVADINSYAIRQGTAANAPILTIDGIRIATNWGAALGNPQYDANATIAAGNYNTVTVLDGTLTAAGSLTVNNEIQVSNGADFVIPNNINLIQHGQTNNNSGAVTVNRNALIKRLDYVYWSAPVANQDLKLFSPYTVSPTNADGFPTPTGPSRFYTLNESTNAFEAIVDPLNIPFDLAKGYMLRAPNNFPANTPTTFNGSFRGVPNNGDVSINVFNTGAGMNMIGNPYPSTIDADAFLDANTSLETLYFWTHPANPSNVPGANYATFNAVGPAAPSGTTPPSATPNGTIQVGQGFIAKSTTSTTVNYTNAMRVNNTEGQFFRGVTNEKNRIWLNLSKEDSQLNQILTGYVTNATNDLDPRYDARLIEISGSKLYNVVNNSEYVIQGRALPFSSDDVVALGFKAETAGNYTISLDHVDGLFNEGQQIFIKDNLTNVTHDIKETAFTFASEAGTFNSRFSIVYQNVNLGVEDPTDANSIVVFTKNNTININSGKTTMETVRIFDIQGRLLFEQKDINAATATITGVKAAQQVLIVQVTADNKTISKKVVY